MQFLDRINILSGIQPGKVHIGTMASILFSRIKISENENTNNVFLIADIHRQTKTPDHQYNIDCFVKNIRILTNDKWLLITQSSIENMLLKILWKLSVLCKVKDLNKIFIYHSMYKKNLTNKNTGMFLYPILMCADILLFNPRIVIVGKDQKINVEFAHKMFRKLGKKDIEFIYSDIQTNSFANTKYKMSKSGNNNQGTLYLEDDINVAKEKIFRAVTTSNQLETIEDIYKPENVGVVNLINCVYHINTALSIIKNKRIISKDYIFNKYINTNFLVLKQDLFQVFKLLKNIIEQANLYNNNEEFLETCKNYVLKTIKENYNRIIKNLKSVQHL